MRLGWLLLVALLLPASAAARPTHRWGLPTGAPRGVMLLVHGGAWHWVGPAALELTAADARGFRAQGWITLEVDYRRGRAGLEDVLDFYALARRRYPDLPLCAQGSSAGGHLALMLAVRRPHLDCVIAQAAPVLLPSLSDQESPLYAAWAAYFGPQHDRAWSPALRLAGYQGRLLLAWAQGDPQIPADQRPAMQAARRRWGLHARLLALAAGAQPWVHSPVSRSALADWQREQDRLLRQLSAEGPQNPLGPGAPRDWRTRPAADRVRA